MILRGGLNDETAFTRHKKNPAPLMMRDQIAFDI
jgi:hypothetical protein